jgi:hypothetical protein
MGQQALAARRLRREAALVEDDPVADGVGVGGDVSRGGGSRVVVMDAHARKVVAEAGLHEAAGGWRQRTSCALQNAVHRGWRAVRGVRAGGVALQDLVLLPAGIAGSAAGALALQGSMGGNAREGPVDLGRTGPGGVIGRALGFALVAVFGGIDAQRVSLRSGVGGFCVCEGVGAHGRTALAMPCAT